MPKEASNKRYTVEFKRHVIETMREEGLSYGEVSLRFKICNHHRIQDWERIYLTKETEG